MDVGGEWELAQARKRPSPSAGAFGVRLTAAGALALDGNPPRFGRLVFGQVQL
jgi:hypothetical protein